MFESQGVQAKEGAVQKLPGPGTGPSLESAGSSEAPPVQMEASPSQGTGASSPGAASLLSHWAEGAAVQRAAAGDGTDHGADAGAPGVQLKKNDDAQKDEAPTAGQVGSATIHALQSHMKLTAMRMYAVAANMHNIIGSPSNSMAGVEPNMMGLQQQYELILNDLGTLHSEISRVPDVMRGAMSQELGMLRGAWYDNNGLARALSAAYSYTHDKDGRLRPDASTYQGSVSEVADRLKAIYAVLKVDEGDINNRYMARGTDVADALGDAATEAFDSGLYAIQTCVRRLKADLESMDDKDADVTAADLIAVVSETAASSKAMNAKNLGTAKRTVHDVEALQADLAKRPGPKVAKLAKLIGYNSNVSTNLHALHKRMDEVAKAGKHR